MRSAVMPLLERSVGRNSHGPVVAMSALAGLGKGSRLLSADSVEWRHSDVGLPRFRGQVDGTRASRPVGRAGAWHKEP